MASLRQSGEQQRLLAKGLNKSGQNFSGLVSVAAYQRENEAVNQRFPGGGGGVRARGRGGEGAMRRTGIRGSRIENGGLIVIRTIFNLRSSIFSLRFYRLFALSPH